MIVHDAARPLVDDEVIERVILPLGEGYDGVVPALPLADTVKRVERGLVVETVDRSRSRHRADPAGVHCDRTARCLRGDEPFAATDCASLVEARGGRVRVVEGDVRLLKITTAGRSRARHVVALKAVFFDVGETLIDEERWWRVARRA